ncbi:MAG TPA: 1-phosphofructokinase family hexose kinase [Candidatus Acidoferrum sp.]|nr:1-phosphofructokinase family hexose kinase [Candidatus Acidoferrum sp.]
MNKLKPDACGHDTAFFCVSLNPAIDTRLVLDEFQIGHVNRASGVHRTPGGKAAHVAMALQRLGANPKWIGFAGGATGSELMEGLHRLKIEAFSVPTVHDTRVNVEIIEARGGVTEILEPGGTIEQAEWREFRETCATGFQRVADKKIALISGSQPPGVPAEASAVLLKLAQSFGCIAFLDTSGASLAEALAAGPDFIKINREEAQSVTGIAVNDPVSAEQAVRKLLERGAKSAAISLGDRGIVGIQHRDEPALHAWTAPLRAKSTVGCGDSALAGFTFATASGLPFERSLALAVACGAANCLAPLPARIEKGDVSRFEPTVHVEPVLEKETAR